MSPPYAIQNPNQASQLMNVNPISATESRPHPGVANSWLRCDAEMDQVEALMSRLATGSRLERLGAMSQEHLRAGGKRIRARLVVAAADALGVDREAAIGWAAAVELLHNATLIHDDVQDGDRMRRGRPTAWVRHGIAQAINAGDLMLMLPFLAVGHVHADDATRWRLCEALARRASDTVRGQAEELELLDKGRLDTESFDRAVAGKTGALIALAVEGAAHIAGRAPDEARELGDAFLHLGTLFQIQDDVVDLFGDKGRGRGGCDIEEGKVSALVVAHVALHPEDRPWLLALLSTPRADTSPEMVNQAIERFVSGGALRRVLDRIAHLEGRTTVDPQLNREPALRAIASDLARLAILPIANLSV